METGGQFDDDEWARLSELSVVNSALPVRAET